MASFLQGSKAVCHFCSCTVFSKSIYAPNSCSLTPNAERSRRPEACTGEGREHLSRLAQRRRGPREREEMVVFQGRQHAEGETRAGGSRPARAVVSSLFLRLTAAAGLSLSGCGVWDEVSSREFTIKGMFTKPPDPVVVLKTDQDGDHRARDSRQLKEPKQNGGTDKDQDAFVALLASAARSEPKALVRLAAIQTLAPIQRPTRRRRPQGRVLRGQFLQQNSPGIDQHVPVATLAALGQSGHPAAVDLLVLTLKGPPDRPRALAPTAAHPGQTHRRRRALGNFKQYKSVEALVDVLRKDKDIALRDCVHMSLVSATGKTCGGRQGLGRIPGPAPRRAPGTGTAHPQVL